MLRAALLVAVLPVRAALAQDFAPADTPIGGPTDEQARIVRDVLMPLCAKGDGRACDEMAMLLRAITEQRSGDYRETLALVVDASLRRHGGTCALAAELGDTLLAAPRGSEPREKHARRFLSEACLGCRQEVCSKYQSNFDRDVPSVGAVGRQSGLALRVAGTALVATGFVTAFVSSEDWAKHIDRWWWSIGAVGGALLAGGQWLRIQGQVRSLAADPELTYTPPWFWVGTGIQVAGLGTFVALRHGNETARSMSYVALTAWLTGSFFAMDRASDEAAQWVIAPTLSASDASPMVRGLSLQYYF